MGYDLGAERWCVKPRRFDHMGLFVTNQPTAKFVTQRYSSCSGKVQAEAQNQSQKRYVTINKRREVK
jgi:hypothetical protein